MLVKNNIKLDKEIELNHYTLIPLKIYFKKGKAKIADYEKQIAEYFKDSDITPNFHSMLGEYGDKNNERRIGMMKLLNKMI